MISNKKLLLILVGLDLLIVNSEIKSIFGFVTQLLIVLIAFIVILSIPNLRLKVFSKAPIFLSFIVLCILSFLALLKYGPTINMYLYRYVRLLPLFFSGLILGDNLKHIYTILIMYVLGLILSSSELLLIGNISSVRSGNSGLFADYLYSPYRYLSMSYAAVIMFVFTLNMKKTWGVICLGMAFISALFFLFLGGFTTPIIAFLVAIIVFILSRKKERRGSYIKTITVVAMLLGFFWIIAHQLLEERVIDRITSLVTLLYGNSSELNVVSGGRVYLNKISIDKFLANPFIGIGSYAFIPGVYIIGGHSTVFDILAQFGVLFGGPILCFILSWLSVSVKRMLRMGRSDFDVMLFSIWVSYVLVCFSNPYFLSSALDHFIFFLAGVTVGIPKVYFDA